MATKNTSDRAVPVVAIINTNDDLIELLKAALEGAGFVVVITHIRDIRSARFDAEAFLRVHDPRVLVYDVPPPFDRSWRFMQHLRTHTAFGSRQFVLTSANARAVHEVVKTEETVYEVIGKDTDILMIVRAVKEASRSRPTR